MIGWVRHPSLWASAQDVAAGEKPRWTKAFWQLVMSTYERLGGKLEEAPETETEVEDMT